MYQVSDAEKDAVPDEVSGQVQIINGQLLINNLQFLSQKLLVYTCTYMLCV